MIKESIIDLKVIRVIIINLGHLRSRIGYKLTISIGVKEAKGFLCVGVGGTP